MPNPPKIKSLLSHVGAPPKRNSFFLRKKKGNLKRVFFGSLGSPVGTPYITIILDEMLLFVGSIILLVWERQINFFFRKKERDCMHATTGWKPWLFFSFP